MNQETFDKIKALLIANGVRNIPLKLNHNWWDHLQTLKRISASRIEISSLKKEPFGSLTAFREEISFKFDLVDGTYVVCEYEDEVSEDIFNTYVLKPLYDLSDDGFLVDALNVAFDRIIDRQIQKEDAEEKRKQRLRVTNQLLGIKE